jgi:hypothetical protein
MARPMPLLLAAPVTRATLPSRLFITVLPPHAKNLTGCGAKRAHSTASLYIDSTDMPVRESDCSGKLTISIFFMHRHVNIMPGASRVHILWRIIIIRVSMKNDSITCWQYTFKFIINTAMLYNNWTGVASNPDYYRQWTPWRQNSK